MQSHRIEPSARRGGSIETADALARISRYLRLVRRRRAVVAVVRDCGLCLGGAALALLAIMLVAPLLQRWMLLRVLAIVIAAGSATALAVHQLASLRRLTRSRLARLIGRNHPALRSDLLSTVELEAEIAADRPSGSAPGRQARPAAPSGPRFSPALMAALTRDTARRLAAVDLAGVVPAEQLRPAALLLAVAAVAWASAAAFGPEHLARAASGMLARPTAVQPSSDPLVGDIDLSYRYPPHMQREPRRVQSSTGHITAPLGTRVRLRATPLKPTRQAFVVVTAAGGQKARRHRLQVRGGRELRGELQLRRAGRYTFEITTAAGRTLSSPLQRRIDIEPDAAPRVRMVGADNVEVAARQQVELGYTAEDDYGLREVRLAYRLAGGKTRQLVLWKPGNKTEAHAVGKYRWDLAEIDLARGGRLAYWIEALDNDAVSGPKVGRSRVRYLVVFSDEEKHDRTLGEQRKLLEQALALLSGRLLLFSDEQPSSTTSELVSRGEQLQQSQLRLTDGVRNLAGRMKQDRLVSDSIARSIAALHKRLDKITALGGRVIAPLAKSRAHGTLRSAALRALRRYNGRAIPELERDALLLANMLDEQRLQRLADAHRRLEQAREQLGKLIARYRKTKDPKLKSEILRRIARMRKQLRELMRRMARLQSTIPDEYLNTAQMKRQSLASELDKLRDLVERGKLDQLDSVLKSLDDKLSQMQNLLSGNLRNFRSQRMSQREKAFNEIVDKLHDLESEQRAIAKRTGRTVDSYRARASKLLGQRIAKALDQQRRKLKRLRQTLRKVKRQDLARYQQSRLRKARRWSDKLDGALSQRDLAQSLKLAKQLNEGLKELDDDLRGDAISRYLLRRSPLERSARRVSRARGVAEQIENDLEGLLPPPGKLLRPDERQELGKLRRRQRKLEQRLRELSSKLAKGKQPLGKKLPDGLSRSGKLMQKSARQLGRLRPQQAHSSQQQAARSLAELRDKLRRQRQPRRWSAARSTRQRIKIPGSESFKPPKDFRQDILDAMREKAPAQYQDQVKRYYRELVR